MTITQSPLAIPLFDQRCFGGIIKKPDDGLLSICFMGYLLLPEGRRRAYFKTETNGYAMLNEEIGYILAYCAGLPQPKAGKIWIHGSVMHQFNCIKWPDPSQHALCWVTYEAEDRLGQPAPSIKASVASRTDTSVLELQVIFLKLKLLGRLIAFDAWVANVDRNIGNILLVGTDSFIVIDHGAILGGADWPIWMHTNPNNYVETKVLDGVFSSPEKNLSLPTKNAIIEEAKLLSTAWQLAATPLEQLLKSNDKACNTARQFLALRSTAIVELLRKHTGLVI
jgi:hypothetical protein